MLLEPFQQLQGIVIFVQGGGHLFKKDADFICLPGKGTALRTETLKASRQPGQNAALLQPHLHILPEIPHVGVEGVVREGERRLQASSRWSLRAAIPAPVRVEKRTAPPPLTSPAGSVCPSNASCRKNAPMSRRMARHPFSVIRWVLPGWRGCAGEYTGS